MKKLIFAGLFVAIAAFSANAQKGSILVYGNVNAETISNDEGKSFSIAPGIGYQLNDNWTVGGEFGISTEKGSTPSFQVGPFLRRTWAISNLFSIHSQLGVGYVKNGGAAAFNESANVPGTKGFYATLSGPTISMNVKNAFALNFSVGQLYYTCTKPEGGDNTSKLGLNFGNGITFGISKNFGGKK